MDTFDGQDVYDTPKPLGLITRILQIGGVSGSGDIVLDFFAGSGTTGEAVFDLNSRAGTSSRFVLVQLPEPTGLAEYPTISHIAEERLRRAGKRAKADDAMFNGDVGFRVFKLDSSNIRAWEPDRDNLAESLEASIEHLKTDRTEQDVLFEVLIKLGLDLCVPVQTRRIAGKEVHAIGGGVLLACLSTAVAPDEVEPLALGIAEWYAELAPAGDTTCVFRDSAFADDIGKSNLTAILEQHGLKTVRSL